MISSISRLLCLTLVFATASLGQVELTVHDDRLQVSLMAEAPEIRNPIGIAVGKEDRVYVIESHTSLRPSTYDGPESDRVRLVIDRDGDGEPERIATATEGLHQAMSLAVSPQGLVYVVCASEIVALLDHNDDGIFDGKRTIITLETDYRHPHYRLAGITFDRDGRLYFSRGNMGSHAYTIRGTDGTTISGYGDGGSILRCLPGGTDVEEFATGFWNVVGMDHDAHERLLVADNDPESRGPNRLLHITDNGDYGYRTLFGKGGHHPLLSWEGELPGTLPMVSATREAPSGVLSGSSTSFPEDYDDSVLVACWGESVIERHALESDSLSVNGRSSVLVSGPSSFRPVSMATDSRGIVYITDWASNRYSNHANGGLWTLRSTQPSEDNLNPSQKRPRPTTDAEKVIREIRAKRQASDAPRLLNLLTHDDAFMTHAAVETLAQPVFWESLLQASNDTTPSIRLGALLALRRAHHPDSANLVRQFLSDSDQIIRITALRWATELRDPQLRLTIDEAILSPKVSLGLLETYLAAKSALSSDYLEALEAGQTPSAFDLPSPSPNETLKTIITSEETNDHLRSLALMHISDSKEQTPIDLLARWAREMSPRLQRAAIKGISTIEDAQERVTPILRSIAENRSYDPQVRADAIATWATQIPIESEWVLPLLDDPRAVVRLEAARALRLTGQVEPALSKLTEHYGKVKDDPTEAPVAEQLEFILFGPHADDKKFASQRPSTLADWQSALQTGGDVNAGRRLFNAAGLLCSQCHTPGAFRNSLGPSLENLGQSVDRDRIVQSLIEPTSDASPAFQAWRIVTKSGVTEQGVQIEWLLDGSLKYIGYEGSEVIVPADDLRSHTPVRESIMPHGLQELMTVREMRELVSYLESLGSTLD